MQKLLQLSRPLIMGILNVTPDSFSDGGCYTSRDDLKRRIDLLALEGADIIDIGGESTRPGAQSVSLDQELDRVIPAIELVKSMTDLTISVDTYKPQVMVEAIARKVDLINDVNALQSIEALNAISSSNVHVCLMHKKGQPKDMQSDPVYENVVTDVYGFLQSRIDACQNYGIEYKRIIIDPGFGFGKSLQHNVELFKNLHTLKALGCPILAGVSRKSMLGQLLGNMPVEERLLPSVVAAVLAVQNGAKIVRVHDVKQTCDAFKLVSVLYEN